MGIPRALEEGMTKEEIKQVILKELRTKGGGLTFAELNQRVPDRGTVSWLYPEGDNIIIYRVHN